MSRVRAGLIAGLAFGIIDIIPMLFMDLPNRNVAMAGAFTSRFAIGFLIPNTTLPFAGWVNGLLISLLMSIPDAIITGAFGPILGFGAIGGIVIGFIVSRKKQ
jgi:sorbitol-specific phosphotransferase system component IIBC